MGDSFIEMGMLLDKINGTIYMFVGVAIILLSYFILLGTPLMTYVNILKNTKEEANRGGDGNTAFVHIKVGVTTLIIVALISIMYFFVFVDVLHVGDTAGAVVKRVLLLKK